MAKATLPTNYQDDILKATMNGKRRYTMTDNSDGTKTIEDVTQYDRVGSDFGAADINKTNAAVNAAADAAKIIDNVNDIKSNTQAGYMMGALAGKQLILDLGGCSLSQEGNDFYITGADSVRKKLGSARYLGSVQNTWVTLNPIITLPYEGNLTPSDADNIRIVLKPDALGKVFMGSRYVPNKAWLVMDAYTVEIDTVKKQIIIKITLRTNGDGIGNCEFRCNFDIYLLSF